VEAMKEAKVALSEKKKEAEETTEKNKRAR
jgi:hypothetical protein